MATDKVLIDGTKDFSGGMDSSRAPNIIAPNQYVYSVNCQLPKNKDGIGTRPGFRCINIIFSSKKDEELYSTGNIQDGGYYWNGNEIIYLVSVSGFIFELSSINKYTYKACKLRYENNPNIRDAYINTVPYGAIINDGQSNPIYIYKNTSHRTRSKDQEIGPGLNGVYVQNRFFYIRPGRKEIYGSTIRNPASLDEAYLTNIFGFVVPDETEELTAIGKRKTIARDATGGNLGFATQRNNYSVDIRGDRANWGAFPQSGVGFVDNSIPDIGATSAYSYEPFNGNVYFRNARFGIMSLNQSQFQFANLDSYSSNSLEASLFLENDTKELLPRCYTKSYKDKLYTTIAPEIKDGKYIYWNGIITYSPDAFYATKDRAQINRYDSVFTGIRPWCITVSVNPINDRETMLIHSYDYDKVNRMYLYDEEIDHDINYLGNKVEIESKILTRSFFQDDFMKQGNQQFYSLSKNPPRNVTISIYTRPDEGYFVKQSEIKHTPNQSAAVVAIQGDPANINGIGGNRYINRQDLFICKGPFNLRRWIRVADPQPVDKTIYKENSNITQQTVGVSDKIFTHRI